MDWLHHKYIGIISSRLENFKRKSANLYNFRCVLCGDSSTHKNKARGYIFEEKGKTRYHCHNCNATMNAANFIKKIDQVSYNEYVYEKLLENKTPEQKDLEDFVNKMNASILTGNWSSKNWRCAVDTSSPRMYNTVRFCLSSKIRWGGARPSVSALKIIPMTDHDSRTPYSPTQRERRSAGLIRCRRLYAPRKSRTARMGLSSDHDGCPLGTSASHSHTVSNMIM